MFRVFRRLSLALLCLASFAPSAGADVQVGDVITEANIVAALVAAGR